MPYEDYRQRYWILGKEEINSTSDNKKAVWALMDKITFDREWYRLGHTLVFFKAGALGKLEEYRDVIVNRLIRWLQGCCYQRILFARYAKRRDQRELLTVCQRQFRKYVTMREWGWFVIIQKTRPLIGMPNPEEELRLLEEKANETYGKYKEALDITKDLEQQNVSLKDEIKALSKQLEAEQGNISIYTDRQAKANKIKSETEIELATQQGILSDQEASRAELAAEVKTHSGSINVVKKDIEDIELAIAKVEQEKANRDHSIRALNDEVAEQDEVINKLNKEKKHVAENQAKSNEDLIVAEEKVEHLTSIKAKLEETLDELEGALDKEKRGRGKVEKEKRKVEGELKVTQDMVGDLERNKRELETAIAKKEHDIKGLAAKLDDEQSLVAKLQKNIKELQGRVEVLEEELEAERQARAKAERQRSDLAREIDQLGERLNEAGGATHAQIELNKKREAEVAKLRKDIEEVNIQHESILSNLKRKHQDAIQEMTEQIEQLQDAIQEMTEQIE